MTLLRNALTTEKKQRLTRLQCKKDNFKKRGEVKFTEKNSINKSIPALQRQPPPLHIVEQVVDT